MPEGAFDAPPVVFLKPEDAIFCHPPRIGETVGRVSGALPPGTLRVEAKGLVGHAKAEPIQFALAAGLPEAELLRLAAQEEASPIPGWSGWTTSTSAAPSVVRLFLAPRSDAATDLYLMTRMRKTGSNDYAWARFTELRLARMVGTGGRLA
jgi:hypothetical protein